MLSNLSLYERFIEMDCVLDENVRTEIADHIHDLGANMVKYFAPIKVLIIGFEAIQINRNSS